MRDGLCAERRFSGLLERRNAGRMSFSDGGVVWIVLSHGGGYVWEVFWRIWRAWEWTREAAWLMRPIVVDLSVC